jgi:hypothetical protein
MNPESDPDQSSRGSRNSPPLTPPTPDTYKCRKSLPLFFLPLLSDHHLGVCAGGLSCDCVSCFPQRSTFATEKKFPLTPRPHDLPARLKRFGKSEPSYLPSFIGRLVLASFLGCIFSSRLWSFPFPCPDSKESTPRYTSKRD